MIAIAKVAMKLESEGEKTPLYEKNIHNYGARCSERKSNFFDRFKIGKTQARKSSSLERLSRRGLSFFIVSQCK